MRKVTLSILACACIFFLPAMVRAQSDTDVLKDQIQALKSELDAVKAILREKPAAAAAIETPPAKRGVTSKWDVNIYGMIKVDASYDDSKTNNGNFVQWVNSETQATRNDNEFNMTERATRLGFDITGPSSATEKTSGKIELDFYGNMQGENRPDLQMRHAYFQLDYPESGWNFLFGQTSDLFSPLNPDVLNYTVQWCAGNIGYRRPQVRVTKKMDAFVMALALARTIDSNPLVTAKDGEDSGVPTLECLMEYNVPKKLRIGVSGHIGREESDIPSNRDNRELNSWSLDTHFVVGDRFNIQGELFTGKNLATYLGGIGQDVNATTQEEIHSTGGWIALGLKPEDSKLSYNLGAGMDNPLDHDVAAGARDKNTAMWINAIYQYNEAVKMGLEVSKWITKYQGAADAKDLRTQVSFIYNF